MKLDGDRSLHFENAKTQTSTKKKKQMHTNYGILKLQRHAIGSQHGVHSIVKVPFETGTTWNSF